MKMHSTHEPDLRRSAWLRLLASTVIVATIAAASEPLRPQNTTPRAT